MEQSGLAFQSGHSERAGGAQSFYHARSDHRVNAGLRGGLSSVTAKIGGADAQAAFAGAQGGFVGLDQVNLQLPRGLAGRGEVDVALTVDGQAANVVRIGIK
ncbi:MAG: hypothetical protein ACREEM_32755 [Blastocatellia bacterium]